MAPLILKLALKDTFTYLMYSSLFILELMIPLKIKVKMFSY